MHFRSFHCLFGSCFPGPALPLISVQSFLTVDLLAVVAVVVVVVAALAPLVVALGAVAAVVVGYFCLYLVRFSF